MRRRIFLGTVPLLALSIRQLGAIGEASAQVVYGIDTRRICEAMEAAGLRDPRCLVSCRKSDRTDAHEIVCSTNWRNAEGLTEELYCVGMWTEEERTAGVPADFIGKPMEHRMVARFRFMAMESGRLTA